MKFVCFGYYDEKKWETMSESEQNTLMDECFAYDDLLRKNGHTMGEGIEAGAALQSVRKSTTLMLQKGKVTVMDGPYAETKEQVGGFFLVEDMNQAIELMSKHPGLKAGPFEIRPVEDMTEAIRASERRRSAATGR